MSNKVAQSQHPVAADRRDERLRQSEGIRGTITGSIDRVRSGDLGMIPVVAGLVVIWTVFEILNPIFLSVASLRRCKSETT